MLPSVPLVDDEVDPSTLLPSWLSPARLPPLFRCLVRLMRQRRFADVLSIHAQAQRGIHAAIERATSAPWPPAASAPPGATLPTSPTAPPSPTPPPRALRGSLSSLLVPHSSIVAFALLARGRLPPSTSASSWPSIHSLLHLFEDAHRRIRRAEERNAALLDGADTSSFSSSSFSSSSSSSSSSRRPLLSPYCAYVRCLCWMGEEEQALRFIAHMDRERGGGGAGGAGQPAWGRSSSASLLQAALREVPVDRLVPLLTQLVKEEDREGARKVRVDGRHLDSGLERLLHSSSLSPSSLSQSASAVWALFGSLRLTPSPRALGLLLHPRLCQSPAQVELLKLLSAPAPLPRWFPSHSTSTLVHLLRALARQGEWDRVFALLPPLQQPQLQRSAEAAAATSATPSATMAESGGMERALATVRRLLRSTRSSRRGRGSDCSSRGRQAMTGDDYASLLRLVLSADYHHTARVPSLSTFLALYRLADEHWALGGGQRLWLQAVRKSGEWQQAQLVEQLACLHVDLHCHSSRTTAQHTQPEQPQRRIDRLQRALIDAAASMEQPSALERITTLLFPTAPPTESPPPPSPLPPAVSLSVFTHWLEVQLRRVEGWPALMAALTRLLQARPHSHSGSADSPKHSAAEATGLCLPSPPLDASPPRSFLREPCTWLRLCRAAGEESNSRLASLLRLVWSSRTERPALNGEELSSLQEGGGAELCDWVRGLQALRAEGGVDAAIDLIAEHTDHAADDQPPEQQQRARDG